MPKLVGLPSNTLASEGSVFPCQPVWDQLYPATLPAEVSGLKAERKEMKERGKTGRMKVDMQGEKNTGVSRL